MSRRLVLVLAVPALLVASIGVASAHDSTYIAKATSLISHCGSDWHESSVYAGAYMEENGTSGTEQFRAVFYLQWWDGAQWNNGTSKSVSSGVFADDSRRFVWRPTESGNEAFEIPATLPRQDQYIRARVQFDWLRVNADGSRTLLHRHTSPGSSFCLVGTATPPGAAVPNG